MTSEQDIHEAIAHARHVADSHDDGSERRAWHLQLAEWLEELVRLRRERAAVVAWLRTQEALDLVTYYGDDGSVTFGLGAVSDAIERGDHLEVADDE